MSFSHYFAPDENLGHERMEIEFYYTPPGGESKRFCFITDSGVFSKNKVDDATAILLGNLPALSGDILDIGCGYGCVGVSLAGCHDVRVTMADVNARAVGLARENAQRNEVRAKAVVSDRFESITESFDFIISNPPIRAGKQVVFDIYDGAYAHLRDGGALYVVIRQQHGAPSTIKKLEDLFGSCKIIYKKKGVYVLRAAKGGQRI